MSGPEQLDSALPRNHCNRMYELLTANSPNMGNTKFRVNKVAWYINELSSALRTPLSPHRAYMGWRVLRSYMAIETEGGI
jgi:hypothetical protein